MKVLFSSYLFHPSVGGIESVSNVQRPTFNVQRSTENSSYCITRRPSIIDMVRQLRRCDLFFQNNISLRSLIPALLLRKPILVVHQTWLTDPRGKITWNNRLKRALLPRVTNVAISKAVADSISGHSFVIGNPYGDAVFRSLPNVIRDKSLIFVGRLVSDKGADLLLQAIKLLQGDGLSPDLTIVGGGPEEEKLRKLTTDLALDRSATGRIRRGEQVTFAGQKSGAALAELLNRHRILVVPSRWAEPFGIVILEAAAFRCPVVATSVGGIPEILQHGVNARVVPPDDPAAYQYMLRVNGMRNYRRWHKDGDAPSVEDPAWRAYLPLDDKGVLVLTKERAVELAWLNSRDYQAALETLYEQALALTLQRFAFALHWFGSNITTFTGMGDGDTATHVLTTSSSLGFNKLLAAGGQLLVDFANSFVFRRCAISPGSGSSFT